MDNNMLLTLLPLLMGNQGGGNPNADMFSKLLQTMNPGASPPFGGPPKTCTIKRDDAHCYPSCPPLRPCPPPTPYPPCPSPYPPCPPPYPPCPPPYPPCPPPYPQPRSNSQPYNPQRPYEDNNKYQRGSNQQNSYYNPYGSTYTQARAEIPKEFQYPPLPAGDLSVESVMGVFDMMTKKD